MICTAFRNEGLILSSELIADALAATRWRWPDLPDLGMITFVDPKKVRSKRNPGYCYLMAGFEHVGRTKVRELLAFQLTPDKWPEAMPPNNAQLDLFA